MPGSDQTFDELASRYEAWFATPLGVWADRYEMDAVLRLLEIRPGERVLDVGVGTGHHAIALAGRDACVVGLDSSPEMLRIAGTRVRDLSVELLRADANHLPFKNGSFDAVLAVTSLCFTADAYGVLQEVHRVLRPGGRLVLGELNRLSLWGTLRRAEALVRPTTYRAAHFWSIRELHRMLISTGFDVGRWEGLLHLPPVNNAHFLRVLDPLERFGQLHFPGAGAFLAIQAFRGDKHPGALATCGRAFA
jgi:ubiquinone/menaquinone biosynthesis C-methylase UbiE